MPITYLSPGVYVEEISGGGNPIEPIGTSTAAFLGRAPKTDARVNEPYPVNNWTQFVNEYVGDSTEATHLVQAVYGFFGNGGSRCYIVNLGDDGPLVGEGRERRGVTTLEAVDEVAIVAAPGYTDPAAYDAIISHCEKMQDRIAVLDGPENVRSTDDLIEIAKPAPPGSTEPAGAGLRPRTSDPGQAALYWPWITVNNAMRRKELINVPPSGHVAGIYARTDATRGVHKAPANEVVRGALNVTYQVTREEQGELNSAGVNCIRFFPREGIRVWGSRTLAKSSSEWKYVPVRRLFNMVEKSIARSTSWVVFEPNNQGLWNLIRRDVGAFLTMVWRDGALVGSTAEEAFFVKCDTETNPPESVDLGRVVTVIGLAVVKPAEFVIFRIGQTAAGAEITTEEGGEQ